MKLFIKHLMPTMWLTVTLIGCQNELPVNTENSESINSTVRAVIPADAVEIPDTTTVFQFENNTPYYIADGVEVNARAFNSTSYQGVNLYVEGTWNLLTDGSTDDVLVLPTGLNITIIQGGQVYTLLPNLIVQDGTGIFIAEGGELYGRSETKIQLGINANSGGYITNYGTYAAYTLDAKNGSFYNLEPGVFTFYYFTQPSVSSQYVNTGTVVSLTY